MFNKRSLNEYFFILLFCIIFTLLFFFLFSLTVDQEDAVTFYANGDIYDANYVLNNPELEDIVMQNDTTRVIANEIEYWNFNSPDDEKTHRMAATIYIKSIRENVDPLLITAIGVEESNLRYNAPVSSAGAKGTFQLMPVIEQKYNLDATCFYDNTRGAAKFIRHLKDIYDDNLDKVLAHYNGGNNVTHNLNYNQAVRSYVWNVNNIYDSLKNKK